MAKALGFADALAAGPAVAAAGGSLLLVGATVTPALAEELVRSDPQEVLVAGLAGAVPAGVVTQVQGLFAPSSEGTPPPPMRQSLTPDDPAIPDTTWKTQVAPYPAGAELRGSSFRRGTGSTTPGADEKSRRLRQRAPASAS